MSTDLSTIRLSIFFTSIHFLALIAYFVCRWSYDTTSGADKFDTARCYRCKCDTDYTCIYTKGYLNIALNHDILKDTVS